MSDYLVHKKLTAALDAPGLDEAVTRERVAGAELVEQGVIRGLWQFPGTMAEVGIWSADDADDLHRLLQSLPLFPYVETTVTALAAHPLLSAAPGASRR